MRACDGCSDPFQERGSHSSKLQIQGSKRPTDAVNGKGVTDLLKKAWAGHLSDLAFFHVGHKKIDIEK